MTKVMFDTIIHAPNRLQICALLDTTKELEFQIIKEQLEVSDSVLSKHLKVLEDASYVQLIKKTEFTRQRTWVSLTPKGRKSFKLHLRELKRIVGKI
jgi:DNA-binding MarR family transcriptional regulator